MNITTSTIKIGNSIKHKLECPCCKRSILIDENTSIEINCFGCGESMSLVDKLIKNGRTILVVHIKEL